MSVVKISAADVKKLRDLTGAGMMDCKKALSEAEGNPEKAIEILRKKGQKLSAKRANRDTKEGTVIAITTDDKTRGVIVKLGCETDFVSKNEAFVEMTKKFAQIALDNFPADLDAFNALPFDDITVGEKVIEQVGVIGEKLSLTYAKLEANMVAPYIHMGNKAGVLVGLSEASDALYTAGRDVAMQVAAMSPVALDKDGVDQSVIDKEIEIGMDQARQEGKPEAILEKIAMGKLNKFFRENTLVNQSFVKDNKVSVGDYINSVQKGTKITDFKHVTLG